MPANYGKGQADQNRNDRNDDEKLNQSEAGVGEVTRDEMTRNEWGRGHRGCLRNLVAVAFIVTGEFSRRAGNF